MSICIILFIYVILILSAYVMIDGVVGKMPFSVYLFRNKQVCQAV